jgi:hypothetical protein
VRDPDQNFAFAGRCDIEFDNLQGLAGLEGNGGTGFHGKLQRGESERAKLQ